MRRRVLWAMILGAAVAVVGCGSGDNGSVAAPCVPACRDGYACSFGNCVSACNPPCGPTELCAVVASIPGCVSRDAAAPTDATAPPVDVVIPPMDASAGTDVWPMDVTAPDDGSLPPDASTDAPVMDAPGMDGAHTDTPTGTDVSPASDGDVFDVGTLPDTTPVPCGALGQLCCDTLACLGGLICDTSAGHCVTLMSQPGECHRASDCHGGSVCGGPSGCAPRWCYLCQVAMGVARWDAPCTGASQCASGVCFRGHCSAACDFGGTGDADCTAIAAGSRCVAMIFGLPPISDAGIPATWQTFGACTPGCARNADCGAGRVCLPTANLLLDRLDLTCGTTTVAGTAGTPCTDGSTCASGLCILGAFADGGGGACTAPCVTNADCPAAAPVCSPITYETPSGGPQPGNGCLPAS